MELLHPSCTAHAAKQSPESTLNRQAHALSWGSILCEKLRSLAAKLFEKRHLLAPLNQINDNLFPLTSPDVLDKDRILSYCRGLWLILLLLLRLHYHPVGVIDSAQDKACLLLQHFILLWLPACQLILLRRKVNKEKVQHRIDLLVESDLIEELVSVYLCTSSLPEVGRVNKSEGCV